MSAQGSHGGPPHPKAMEHAQLQAAQEAKNAKTLVMWSHIVGWGGIGMLFIVGPVIGMVSGSAMIGAVLAGLGLVGAVVGAILGQVGRAMQGRVI